MARIKQRYLDELEHEFNTIGQVTLRVRPIAKTFNWVVMPLVWLGSVAVLWLTYVEGTWKDPRAWLLLAGFVALAIMIPAAAVRMIVVLLLKLRPQDKLATRDWVITREGLYPPDFARISEEIPPLFYSWDEILHIDAQQFPNRCLIPYTAIIAPDVHTVERFRTERPHIKGKLPYYYLNGNIRPAHITWRHTRDARTLAEFLNRCKAQCSSNTRR